MQRFVCRVVVYDLPHGPITMGEQVMVHFYTSKCAGKIASLISIVDPQTGAVTRKFPKTLKAKEYANI